MSYLIFARKYRPQTFAEVLGQDPIVTTLSNAIRQRRIGQAYLFTGPRGTGKTSTARIFAKSLNCEEGPTEKPCLRCSRCEEIAQGRSLDVLEIDGASNRGIDQIRALREHSKFTPVSGTFKVYIIDEVHQITAEGFNALLKTLEEPPEHVLFILATTAPHKVPPTILSRCQRYDFKRLSMEQIAKKIKGIAAEEKLKVEEEAVLGIARAASGSLRDAESILDQVASFAEGRITVEDVRMLLGMIDEDVFVEAVEGILAKEPVRVLRLVADAANAGTDLIQWSVGLLVFLRNLLVAKVGAGPLGFEDLGPDSVQRVTRLSEKISLEDLTAMAHSFTSVVEVMRRVGEPRIPLEMALVRLATAESLVSVAELIERLDRLDEQLGGSPPAPPQPAPVRESAAASRGAAPGRGNAPAASPGRPAPAAPEASTPKAAVVTQPGGSSVALAQMTSIWPQFLKRMHQEKASAAAYLSEAAPVSVEPGEPLRVVIGMPKGFEFHYNALSKPAMLDLIGKALGDLLGSSVRCSMRVMESMPSTAPASDPGSEPDEPPPPQPPSGTGQPDSSLLNSVIDLFEGRLLPGGEA